jgi:hypothetical protein
MGDSDADRLLRKAVDALGYRPRELPKRGRVTTCLGKGRSACTMALLTTQLHAMNLKALRHSKKGFGTYAKLIATCLAVTVVQTANAGRLEKIAAAAGEKAGKEAAEKLVQGMDLATRNLALMTNQFGLLIQDLDSTDAEKKRHAIATLTRVLGADLVIKDNVAIEVSAQFENVLAEDNVVADIRLTGTDNPAEVQAVIMAISGHLPEKVGYSAPSPRQLDIATADIKAALEKVKEFPGNLMYAKEPEIVAKCGQMPTFGPESAGLAWNTCITPLVRELASTDMANAILAPHKLSITVPQQGLVTRSVRGGRYAALIISKPALLRIKDKVKVTMWAHFVGKPTSYLRDFKFVQPPLNPNDMLKNCVDTKTEQHGTLCYGLIHLKLDDIMAAK